MNEISFSASDLAQLKKLFRALRAFVRAVPELDNFCYEDRLFLCRIWDDVYATRRALGRYGIDWRDIDE